MLMTEGAIEGYKRIGKDKKALTPTNKMNKLNTILNVGLRISCSVNCIAYFSTTTTEWGCTLTTHTNNLVAWMNITT